MAWSAKFTQPIKWGASTLRTLHDARDYILKLPRTKQILPTWQAAVRALLQAAEHGGMWLELARIAMLQALLGPKESNPLQETDPRFFVAYTDAHRSRTKRPESSMFNLIASFRQRQS
jgi:hypothetical protein